MTNQRRMNHPLDMSNNPTEPFRESSEMALNSCNRHCEFQADCLESSYRWIALDTGTRTIVEVS